MDLDRVKYWTDLSDYDMETADAMFRMGKRDAIAAVRRYKSLVLNHFDSATVYLYGSYSKGKARPDSDIDVAVVVPEVKDDFLKASALLWSLTWDVNTLIEPVLIDQSHPSPLYEDILRTGVCV